MNNQSNFGIDPSGPLYIIYTALMMMMMMLVRRTRQFRCMTIAARDGTLLLVRGLDRCIESPDQKGIHRVHSRAGKDPLDKVHRKSRQICGPVGLAGHSRSSSTCSAKARPGFQTTTEDGFEDGVGGLGVVRGQEASADFLDCRGRVVVHLGVHRDTLNGMIEADPLHGAIGLSKRVDFGGLRLGNPTTTAPAGVSGQIIIPEWNERFPRFPSSPRERPSQGPHRLGTFLRARRHQRTRPGSRSKRPTAGLAPQRTSPLTTRRGCFQVS